MCVLCVWVCVCVSVCVLCVLVDVNFFFPFMLRASQVINFPQQLFSKLTMVTSDPRSAYPNDSAIWKAFESKLSVSSKSVLLFCLVTLLASFTHSAPEINQTAFFSKKKKNLIIIFVQ